MQSAFDPPTLLLVDQNAQIARDPAVALAPCALVAVPNGFQALREVNARVFDVYVSDVWLRDWSGLQFCRMVRKIDPHAPIVLYSASARGDHQVRAMRAGASEYLQTPVEPDVVRERVLALAAESRARSVLARPVLAHALDEIMRSRRAEALRHAEGDERAAMRMLERAAKKPARTAFISARGSASMFERWWNAAFARSWAATADPQTSAPVARTQVAP